MINEFHDRDSSLASNHQLPSSSLSEKKADDLVVAAATVTTLNLIPGDNNNTIDTSITERVNQASTDSAAFVTNGGLMTEENKLGQLTIVQSNSQRHMSDSDSKPHTSTSFSSEGGSRDAKEAASELMVPSCSNRPSTNNFEDGSASMLEPNFKS